MDTTISSGGIKRTLKDNGDGTFAEAIAGVASLSYSTATIPNGTALSNALDLKGLRACSIVMPAAWTAASLTFLVSHDGVTYSSLYDDTDTEVAISTAYIVAGRARALTLTLFLPYRYLQLRSGVTAAPANQGADRVFQVIAG